MSHVTSEWVMSHMNESRHMSIESCHTHDWWVMSHTWLTSHVIHMTYESCHTCDSLKTHLDIFSEMSHVTHMTDESCHTHDLWVMSWLMSHVPHMNESCHVSMESCHIYDWWVMSYIWLMSHVTHMTYQSCHDWWVMSHIWTLSKGILIPSEKVSRWVFRVSCVWHDSSVMCVTWLISEKVCRLVFFICLEENKKKSI
jgi:hypothetical protein